jgi:hypothetical protein
MVKKIGKRKISETINSPPKGAFQDGELKQLNLNSFYGLETCKNNDSPE